jgi:hypothetical protein
MKDGHPCTEKLLPGKFYDELVLDQESQVVPIALVIFDKTRLTPAAKNFIRDLPVGAK